jgi:hypothetical protein
MSNSCFVVLQILEDNKTATTKRQERRQKLQPHHETTETRNHQPRKTITITKTDEDKAGTRQQNTKPRQTKPNNKTTPTEDDRTEDKQTETGRHKETTQDEDEGGGEEEDGERRGEGRSWGQSAKLVGNNCHLLI